MASDWLKIRTDLYRDPKVCMIADYLIQQDGILARHISQNTQRHMSVTRNVIRNAVVGALASVWGVMRLRGKRVDDDLFCRYCGYEVVDDVGDLPGLSEAMIEVGWLRAGDEGIVFPNFFEEHNCDPNENAKTKNAERQRRFREKQKALDSNVTVTLQSNTREEKRREEKEENPLNPPSQGEKKKSNRGTSLADDWTLPDDWELEARRICRDLDAGIDVRLEAAKFRDYWHAKPGAGGRKKDWLATWRNWIRTACERKPRRQESAADDPMRGAL